MFSTLILLKRGQKHRETRSVLMVNSTNGSSRIMLYRTASTIRLLLEYKGQVSEVSPTTILPAKFSPLVSRKHSEQTMVEAGPSCRTGNSSRLSRMRMIDTAVIVNCATKHNDYGQ